MLRRQDGHVLIRALDFDIEGEMKKERLKKTCNWQVDKKSMKAGLSMENSL